MHPSVAFLAELFGPDGPPTGTFAQLWALDRPGRPARTYNLTHWLGVPGAVAPGATPDVYVAAGLSPRDTGKGARLKAGDCAGIAGLWLDVDVNGGPDHQQGRAPDKAAAAELASSILEPTFLVDSGYGVQAWWLLPRPWVFGSGGEATGDLDLDRQLAARVEAAAVHRHRELAGFRVDSVHDLARLMRLPGTVNGKDSAERRPVSVIREGPRHLLDVLLGTFGEHEPSAGRAGDSAQTQLDLGLLGSATLDPLLIATMVTEDPRFGEVLAERDPRQRSGQWSASECDLSLCSTAAAAGWTDDQLAALILAHRRQHHPDGEAKALRIDYLRATIAKARQGSAQEAQREVKRGRIQIEQQRVQEALETLIEDAAMPAMNGHEHEERVRRMALFNTVITGDRETAPRFVRLLQQGREHDAEYTLVTADDQHISVGRSHDLMRPEALNERLIPAIGHVMPSGIKRADWWNALAAIIPIAEVVEHEDETTQGLMLDTLRSYVSHQAGMEREDALRSRFPFSEGGQLFVNLSHLRSWAVAKDLLSRGVSAHELAKRLRQLGMERTRLAIELPDGKRDQPWYYRGPASLL